MTNVAITFYQLGSTLCEHILHFTIMHKSDANAIIINNLASLSILQAFLIFQMASKEGFLTKQGGRIKVSNQDFTIL